MKRIFKCLINFDTPLPPTAKHIRAEAPDTLESSIGELAPKGLK